MTIAVLASLALPAMASAGPVPRGFVGMNADGPLFGGHVNVARQLGWMVSSGVERLRVAFNWAMAQPYAAWSDVPADQMSNFRPGPGGVPTDFAATDEIVSLAAQRHLSLLPVVVDAPKWDGSPKGNHIQPARDRPYARYIKALVKRYGRHGTFWTANPGLPRWPVVTWQVWNEPDTGFYWDTPRFARSYVSLLRVAYHAIKRADPSATVVLASLVNYGWRDLASIYRVRGAGRLFDVVSSNPYTSKPSGVITILRRMRRVMDRHGDHGKRLLATEVGWPSALGKTDQNFGFNTTKKGQARKLRQLLPMLAANRRSLGLAGFYYYTWIGTDQRNAPSSFDFSGLLHFDRATDRVYTKPAYRAFRRTALQLEGCAHKATPTSCG